MADPRNSEAFSASGSGLNEPKVGEENEVYVRCEQNFSFDDIQMSVTGKKLSLYIQLSPLWKQSQPHF